MADDYVAAGQLHFIPNAPSFPFPAYAVWTLSKDINKLDYAIEELKQAAKEAPWIEL